jgi:hypothetical protein
MFPALRRWRVRACARTRVCTQVGARRLPSVREPGLAHGTSERVCGGAPGAPGGPVDVRG